MLEGIKNPQCPLQCSGGWGMGDMDGLAIGKWTSMEEDDTGLAVEGKLIALDYAGTTVDDEGEGAFSRIHRLRHCERCAKHSLEPEAEDSRLPAYCCRNASIGSSCEALRAG